MAFSFGFYNAFEHDRLYNSMQISMIFDGIIQDGIYATIGDAMMVRVVSETDNGDRVVVGPGRGWFDHTWNYNDSDLILTGDQSEILLDRIDAIVLDIYSNEDVRENDIKWLVGTPSSNPQRPELLKQIDHIQYPLCYIYRKAGSLNILQEDITNMVGTSECPFVTGVLEAINIDGLIRQWQNQFNNWFKELIDESNNTLPYWKRMWETWFKNETFRNQQEMAFWKNDFKTDLEIWFEDLKTILEPDVAANLADSILELRKKIDALAEFDNVLTKEQSIYTLLQDSNGNPITDNLSDPINGTTKFVTRIALKEEIKKYHPDDNNSEEVKPLKPNEPTQETIIGGGGGILITYKKLELIKSNASGNIDIKALFPNEYSKLTVDDFVFKAKTVSGSWWYRDNVGGVEDGTQYNDGGNMSAKNVVTSYNASTGVLTLTTTSSHSNGSSQYNYQKGGNASVSGDLYLIVDSTIEVPKPPVYKIYEIAKSGQYSSRQSGDSMTVTRLSFNIPSEVANPSEWKAVWDGNLYVSSAEHGAYEGNTYGGFNLSVDATNRKVILECPYQNKRTGTELVYVFIRGRILLVHNEGEVLL